VTNNTAELVIHPPWYITNGVFDLGYTTNVAPGLQGEPISWQFIMRTAPGQTNLYPANASDAQGFYRVGALTPSAGTDFWITFPNLAGDDYSVMTLYLSSAVSNSGTVFFAGDFRYFYANSSTNAFSCGFR
jgi:hypothetical protein